jgi:hypothetical protein
VDWFGWFGFLEAPVVPSNGWSEFAPALDCLPLSKAEELNERWRREMVMDGIAPYWFPIAQFWHSASIVVNCTPEYGTGIQAKTAYLSELAELRSESQWLPNLSTLLRWWAERVETGGWTYDAQVGWREHVAPTSDSERFATGLI